MPLGAVSQARSIEYLILHDARPTGPNIGLYADREIPASVVDGFGRQYVYAGIAPRKCNEQLDVDALQPGEFILMPGLIYRLEHMQPSWLESLFRMH